MAVGMLSGCGGQTASSAASTTAETGSTVTSTAADGEKTKLTFMGWGTDSEIATYKQLISQFEEKYPDVEVEYIVVADNEFDTKLQTMIGAGECPDVFYCNVDNMMKYAATGNLMSLSDYVADNVWDVIFLCLLATMMVPGVVLLVPQFLMYTKFKWIDTLLPMTVPACLCNINNLFFLRQFISGLPNGYLDAAKIDGCTYFGAYWKIYLPMCKPAIIANAIMLFMGTWNDYFGPLIFTHSESKQTIQVAIAMLSSHYEQQTDIPLVMCASLIAVLPVLILFITCQKYFTESFAMTGIKG